MSNQSSQKIQTYHEFWYFYLKEHSYPINRAFHYIGTTGVILLLVWSIYIQNYWYLLLLPVCGYGFAWFGHFFIEKNKPATFTYPFWSLISDFRMYFAFLTGTLKKDLEIKDSIYSKEAVQN